MSVAQACGEHSEVARRTQWFVRCGNVQKNAIVPHRQQQLLLLEGPLLSDQSKCEMQCWVVVVVLSS